MTRADALQARVAELETELAAWRETFEEQTSQVSSRRSYRECYAIGTRRLLRGKSSGADGLTRNVVGEAARTQAGIDAVVEVAERGPPFQNCRLISCRLEIGGHLSEPFSVTIGDDGRAEGAEDEPSREELAALRKVAAAIDAMHAAMLDGEQPSAARGNAVVEAMNAWRRTVKATAPVCGETFVPVGGRGWTRCERRSCPIHGGDR